MERNQNAKCCKEKWKTFDSKRNERNCDRDAEEKKEFPH